MIVKLVLIFITVCLIFIVTYCDKKEEYVASFDYNVVNPRVHPYSKNITFRPDSNESPDMLNKFYETDDSTKMFTHIEDQDMGVNLYANTADTDPYKNYIRPQHNFQHSFIERRKRADSDLNLGLVTKPTLLRGTRSDRLDRSNRLERLYQSKRDVDVDLDLSTVSDSDRISRTVKPNVEPDNVLATIYMGDTKFLPDTDGERQKEIERQVKRNSIYYETDIDGNIINETNNIGGSCSRIDFFDNSVIETHDHPLIDDDDIDRYADVNEKIANDTMSDEDYAEYLSNLQNMTIYSKDTAVCGIEEKEKEECERNLKYEKLSDIIDRYRSNTNESVRSFYRNSSYTVPVRKGVPMYDIIDF